MPRMRENDKTKEKLKQELAELRQRVAELRGVAARHKGEDSLQGAEEEYQAIFNGVKNGIVMLDLTGKVLKINTRITEVSGYTEEDVIGKRLKFLKMFPPKSIGTILTAFAQTISGQQMPPFEVEVRTKIGERIFVEITSSLFKKSEKNFGIVAIIRDITERKRAEEELKKYQEHLEELIEERTAELTTINEQLQREVAERKQAEEELRGEKERYQQAMNNSPNQIFTVDRDGKIQTWNRASEKLFQYSRKEIIGQRYHKLLWNPKDIPILEAKMAKIWKGRSLHDQDVSYRCKDGTQRFMLSRFYPMYSRGGIVQECVVSNTDVTKRRQTEEALRESEERFRAIFETAQDSIYLKDRDLRFTAVNPAFERHLGIPAKKIIGTTGAAFLTKEGATRIKKEASRVFKGEFVDKEEHSSIKGKSAIYHLIKVPIRNSAGEIVGICGMGRDITERKRTEELLRQERESLHEVLERAPYGVFVRDKNGKTLYVNPAFTAITGYTITDIPTLHDWAMLAYPKKQYRNMARAAWEKDSAQQATDREFRKRLGRVFTRTFNIRTKRGAIKEVEFRPALLGDGRTLMMLADVTERRRAEEALRQSEERLRTLIETTKAGVSGIDTKGIVTYANEHLCKLWGRSQKEIMGRSVYDFLDAENRKVLKGLLAKRKKGMRDDSPYELIWTKKDGGKVHTIMSPTPTFDVHGQHQSSFAIITDITERVRMQEALRQNREHLQALMDNAPVAFTWADMDGNIQYINRKFHELFGYTLDDIPTTDELRRVAYPQGNDLEAYTAQVLKQRERLEQGKEAIPIEVTLTCKDGSTRHVTAVGAITSNQRMVIYNDITERKRMEEELRQNQQELQALMDASPLCISWADMQGNVQYNNHKFCEFFGYTVEDMPTVAHWRRLAYPDPAYRKQVPTLLDMLKEAQQQGKEAAPIEVTITCKDGSIRHVLQAGSLVGNRILVMYSDITERKRIEEALRESEEKYRALVEFTEDSVCLIDRDKRYLYINEKYLSRLGLPRSQVIGRPYGDFHSREDNKEFSEHVDQVFKAGRFAQYEHKSRRDDRHFLRTLSPVKKADEHIEAVTMIAKDITERKRAETELVRMATHDSLTGLPNRMLFNDRLALALTQAHRHKKKLALMLLDLDYFKDVNDSLGHNVGDQLLRAVGDRLKGLLRRDDTIARVGGDEFLVLLSEIASPHDAVTIAQKILDAFRQPFVFDDHELQISTSIGFSLYPDDADDADTLLKYADIAMYHAKDKGRGNYQRYAPK
ncbi:MAG: PAS domain S-box protein [Deltaproteobacteria bacterium]|nr:PAS domain S-box protein [Deltaproteobacteria bacterium]